MIRSCSLKPWQSFEPAGVDFFAFFSVFELGGITIHLMTGPSFVSPRPQSSPRRTSRVSGKQTSLFSLGPVIKYKCLIFQGRSVFQRDEFRKTLAWNQDFSIRQIGERHRLWKGPFLKCFPPSLKRKAGVFKFLRFEERCRKVPFSWRIGVDDRPLMF